MEQNQIKEREFLICTTKDMEVTGFGILGNPMYKYNCRPYEVNKKLPGNTLFIKDNLELDNGYFISIKSSLDKRYSRGKSIKILENKDSKKGYEFMIWRANHFFVIEEPIYLGGIENKNSKITNSDNKLIIKTPFDINIDFIDNENKKLICIRKKED